MSKNLRKIAAFVLAMVLCMSAFTAAQAGAWYGGNLSVTITKGEKGYTFQSVYSAPTHAYEMSGHMVSSDGVSHAIPQTLVLVPADSSYTWTPNGMYGAGANYEVLYCCDAVTGYDNGIHYKRMNLEDSAYYTPAAADKIRAIVSISYPFRSMDEMKAALRAKGFADANKLTRSEIISAVQAAIWYYANGVKYSYSRTFEVASNSQWGGVMHEYGAEGYENQTWLPVGKRKFAVNTEVGARIDALRDFLIALPGVDAREGQIVITGLDILGFTPSRNGDGTYDVRSRLS